MAACHQHREDDVLSEPLFQQLSILHVIEQATELAGCILYALALTTSGISIQV